jgi:hypothetical protein
MANGIIIVATVIPKRRPRPLKSRNAKPYATRTDENTAPDTHITHRKSVLRRLRTNPTR